MKNDYADMVVTHLNAPYGPVLEKRDLILALKDGNLNSFSDDDLKKALLSSLFVECSGGLIAGACVQAGIDLQNAHDLYKHIVERGGHPPVFRWEDAVKEILC